MSPGAPPCPLCAGPSRDYARDRRRSYRQCGRCALVFVPAWQHVSRQAEKAEYDRHQNDPADPGYRRFLARLFEPLQARLAPAGRGLDFGCGPGPALAGMFEQAGHSMQLYDPFYAPDCSVLAHDYDFITATEVVEHLSAPGLELRRLFARLRPGGYLGIMTQRVIDRAAFQRWRYKDDLTHICFFADASFRWLAGALGADLEFIGRDVVLLRRGAAFRTPGRSQTSGLA